MIKKSAYLGIFLLFLLGVISCEKDFTDIGSSVINNNVFETKDTLLDIFITQKDIDAVRADGGISFNIGEYLLGVYASKDNNGNVGNYRTIEASIVSQVGFLQDLKVVDRAYGTDTTVVTKMDKVLIRLPYQSSNTGKNPNGSNKYRIDSILGDPDEPVSLNVYENLTFLNRLDPTNPTQQNSYNSDAVYSKGDLLNENAGFTFTVPQNLDVVQTLDTVFYFNRNLSNGSVFKDSIKINNSAPFFVIPLDKNEFKTKFLDEYESGNFQNADAFNNYFRGLIIEATGVDGSLIPFNFSSIIPSLDVSYTNTILKNGVVVDTITKTNSFPLNGVRNSVYNNSNSSSQTAEFFTVQGTVGTSADIAIFQGSQLADLRGRNWLINDASLIFYIEKTKDTTHVPGRLFLHKNGVGNPSQIKDIITIGANTFGGELLLDNDSRSKDRYHFRITDYVSDLLSGESSYNPPLSLRVFNPTDLPNSITDTIVRSYNWNPRGIVLHGNSSSNLARKAQLKISYSIKK